MNTEQAIWDEMYASSDRVWSGKPNDALVHETTDLRPGTALDLGCGEGGDAIWLAQQSWVVTAVDISHVALDRAKGHAASAGVGKLIDWQQCDLAESFPTGTFDLVSCSFLHSHGELPRERILRNAAAAVQPGGVLLIVGHAEDPAGHESHGDENFPAPGEVLRSLELPAGQWEVLVSEEHRQTRTGPDGESFTRRNNTLKLRRSDSGVPA